MKNKTMPAKRINIVSIKMIRESSVTYANRKVTSHHQAVNIMNDFLVDIDREKFIVMCLNAKNEPTAIHTVSIGSLNASIVHPREVFKPAILSNSNAVICFHNHPSGDPEPSREDINITNRLVDVGDLLGIKVLDHIVIGDRDRYISFKKEGLL